MVDWKARRGSVAIEVRRMSIVGRLTLGVEGSFEEKKKSGDKHF